MGTYSLSYQQIVVLLNNVFPSDEDRTPNSLDLSDIADHVELEEEYPTDSEDEQSLWTTK